MADARRARFEKLTLPLEKDLYFAALSLARQEADALDLVQETYLHAYRGFDTYRTDENIRGWMFTILRHTYLDLCRRRKTEPMLTALEADRVESPPPSAPLRLEDALPDDLLRAFRTLTPAHQILIQLSDIERLSYKEIAAVLDCPIGSVMSGLHNARTRLRAAIERQKTASPKQ